MIDLLLKICSGFLCVSVISFGVWAFGYIFQESRHKTEKEIIKSKFSKITLILIFSFLGLGIILLTLDGVLVLIDFIIKNYHNLN